MRSEGRLARLRERMRAEGADAFLAFGHANVTYLTGFDGVFDDGSGAVCAVTGASAAVFTDGRFAEAATSAAAGTPWQVDTGPDRPLARACEHVAREGARAVATEASVPLAGYRAIAERFTGTEVVSAEWVEGLREVKEPAELERIARATELADAAMRGVPALLRAGRTERDVALDIEFSLRRAGSEGVAFPLIVGAGPGSSRPHAVPGDHALTPGDLVVVDLGARVDGYCSDLTRTFCLGKADDRQRGLHAAVLAANEAGRAAVRAGVTGKDADAAARAVLADAGLGDAFVHGLGHGVGLEVHELPSLGAAAEAALPAGAVVTVEPGAYLPGVGGVRIEDLVVVGEGGCRVLSAVDRGLIEVD